MERPDVFQGLSRYIGVRPPIALLALLLLVPLGLAGCATPPAHGTSTDLLTAGSLLSYTQVAVGIGGDAETSITVGPDGLILACSHGGFGKPSPSWVSRDNGATWKQFFPSPNPVPSGDCDLAVLEDGTWAMVYDTIASATVAVSRDHGETWSVMPVAALPFGGVDRPWIVADHDTLVLAYANVMANEPAVDTVAISTDHGQTWVPHIASRSAPPDRPQAVLGKPLVYDGTIRLPLARTDLNLGGQPTSLEFATSHDGGSSWAAERVASVQGSFILPSATRDGNGVLYFSVPSTNGTANDVGVMWSLDDGKTWSKVAPVRQGVTFGGGPGGVSAPWVDGRAQGGASMAWFETDANGLRSVWVADLDPTSATPATHVRAVTNATKDTAVFEFLMLDHDAQGHAHLVYPLNTGSACHDNPQAGRGNQCIYAVNQS
jgi:hypothetical protein